MRERSLNEPPPGRLGGAVRSILFGRLALPSLLAAVVALRATGLVVGLVNLDECDFWLFGKMVREGAAPYAGVVDIKPPLTYLAFQLAALAGDAHWRIGVPLLGIAAVIATALLLRATARGWSGDERTGWAAAWLTLAAGLCEAPAVNAEILMNLPAAGALYAAWRAERCGRPVRWDLLAGLASGIAALFKCQAGILLVALGLALLWPALRRGSALAERRRAAARAGALTVGFCAPWAATALLFHAGGYFDGFLHWVVTRNFDQISSARVFSLPAVLPSVVAALCATSFAWWLALRQARRRGDAFQLALVLLLGLTFVPVSIGGRFYEHYFLQFVPPLALLGARELVALADRFPALGRRRRAGVLALALLPVVANIGFNVWRGLAGGYPGQDPKARAIAAWLAANTRPDERVFLWGDYSAIYCMADRLPGTRYMRTAPHVGDFDPLHLPAGFDFAPHRSRQEIANTIADLEANRPAIAVDTAAADVHRWSLFPLRKVPELYRYIAERYLPVASPGGAVVYRRREAGTVGAGR
jgi:hypothetical protein